MPGECAIGVIFFGGAVQKSHEGLVSINAILLSVRLIFGGDGDGDGA